ncbi:hypothetical protein NMY22_g2127 [Coprinellus aureogranulatus]|nr:hypothetical protein NMY22_g2127 [Coprinellus aureogranulatus]
MSDFKGTICDETLSQEVPSAQCAFFGTKCKDTMIVPVPIHCDIFEEGTALDVDFRIYINIAVPWATIAYDMSQFMIEVEGYATENGTEGPWNFTIFFSHHCLDSQNTLVSSIPGGEYLDIGGAVLVVKSLPSGRVEHVLPSDIPCIKRMLVSTLTSSLRRAKGQTHLRRIVFPLPIVAPRRKRPQLSRTIASEEPHPSAYCMFMPSPTDYLAPQGTPESHTLHVDPVHPTHVLPGYDIHHIEDILIEIMCHYNWKTVVAFSRVASTGRVAARSHVQAIPRLALCSYVGFKAYTFHSLMRELALSRGSIGGSIGRRLLETHSEYTTTHNFPSNANTLSQPQSVNVTIVDISSRVMQGSQGSQSMKVTVIESSSSGVMQTSQGSPLASQTNFISPPTVYCFYPNLIGQIATVQTDLLQPPSPTQARLRAPYTVNNDNRA